MYSSERWGSLHISNITSVKSFLGLKYCNAYNFPVFLLGHVKIIFYSVRSICCTNSLLGGDVNIFRMLKKKRQYFAPTDNCTFFSKCEWLPIQIFKVYIICIAPLSEWRMFNTGFSRYENSLEFTFLWRCLWRERLIKQWDTLYILKAFLFFLSSENKTLKL